MSTRTYGQHCGLAYAMDLLGERWTLLVVRELMLGPKRYRDLHDRLPGIGTNLLAARLKSLEAAGVIERTTLPAPAGVPAYALTAAGEGLRAVLESFALWGYGLMPPEPGEDADVRAAWALLTMAAELRRAGGPGVAGVVELRIGDETVWIRATGADAVVRDGPAPLPADAIVTLERQAFLELATARLTVARAVRDRRLQIEGDRALAQGLLGSLRLPGAAAALAA